MTHISMAPSASSSGNSSISRRRVSYACASASGEPRVPIRSGSTIMALSALLLLVGRVVLDDDDDEGRCEDVEKDETTTAAPPTSTMDDADGNFIVYCKNNADVEYGSSNE